MHTNRRLGEINVWRLRPEALAAEEVWLCTAASGREPVLHLPDCGNARRKSPDRILVRIKASSDLLRTLHIHQMGFGGFTECQQCVVFNDAMKVSA